MITAKSRKSKQEDWEVTTIHPPPQVDRQVIFFQPHFYQPLKNERLLLITDMKQLSPFFLKYSS